MVSGLVHVMYQVTLSVREAGHWSCPLWLDALDKDSVFFFECLGVSTWGTSLLPGPGPLCCCFSHLHRTHSPGGGRDGADAGTEPRCHPHCEGASDKSHLRDLLPLQRGCLPRRTEKTQPSVFLGLEVSGGTAPVPDGTLGAETRALVWPRGHVPWGCRALCTTAHDCHTSRILEDR